MWHNLLLLHRYLGIGIGLLVAAWCLSGVVMMYMPYPEFGGRDELRSLDPIDLDGCCTTVRGSDTTGPLASIEGIDRFVLEMSAGRLVTRLVTTNRGPLLVDMS